MDNTLQFSSIIQKHYWNFNTFAPCAPLGGWQCRPTFGQQHLKNGKRKHCLCRMFFKEYSTSFLMVWRLIDIALVVIKLLMFKVCVIIGISKVEFFSFPGAEWVKVLKSLINFES